MTFHIKNKVKLSIYVYKVSILSLEFKKINQHTESKK